MRLRYFIFALLPYSVGLLVILYFILRVNSGHFVYAVDDAYIHMAVAKNYVLHGVFGITRYGFTSALSSILWPWLLIGSFKLTGINVYVPLVLNALSFLLLALLSFILLSPKRAFLFTLSATFLGSTLGLTFIGMEHNLQILTTLLLFTLATGTLKVGRWERLLLFFASLLVTSARYEGMAVVLVLAAYRLIRRDVVGSLLMLIGGALPVVTYGVWSLSNGWYFFPTSVLTKSYRFDLGSPMGWVSLLFLRALRNALILPGVYVLWVLPGVFVVSPLAKPEFRHSLVLAFLIFTIHLYFGNVHWFYRYEAYIVVLALFVLIRSLNTAYLTDVWKGTDLIRKAALVITTFLVLFPVLSRGYMATAYVVSGSNELYRQDYQMAMFIKEYYDGQPVVLNDVGNVAFYTDARIIDLWGLATLETAKMLLEGRYTWENVDRFVKERGCRIALLYGDVFAKRYFPIRWEEVGLWYLLGPRRFVVGNKAVYFYVVYENADTLRERFVEYSKNRLPKGVYWEVLTPSP